MNLQISDKACAIYCQQLSSATAQLTIIQALLDGLTPAQILEAKLTPNLTPRTVLAYCERLQGVIKNAISH